MNLDDLAARIEAGRTIAVAIGDIEVSLRLPTDHQMEVATAGMRADYSGQELIARVTRTMVEQAVTAWKGVSVDTLLGDGDADPLPCEARTVPWLLDQRPDVAAELVRAFYEGLAARRARREDAAKN
jgi:hypothetical protein